MLIGLSATAGDNKKKIRNTYYILLLNVRKVFHSVLCSGYRRGGNPIMITGESGTGKELVAKGIHQAGPMPQGPFIAVNVSAIPARCLKASFLVTLKERLQARRRLIGAILNRRTAGLFSLTSRGTADRPANKTAPCAGRKNLSILSAHQSHTGSMLESYASNSNIEKACQKGNFRLD